ncbi:hypothetical protein F5J12DRAFT_893938 [Pisolithus orientalis]|uniref:uncharacterized protein n=1 Tax=Pisolithus orientalis TaxID=936130 RepID=UPI0022259411|nr:uncharacterized protein F5J12DRAFT_893938 [Pisolithus orientalis]KAI6003299.1 hypothetical protein F5J12DRAFT_893938 [Pisolithus orientalis]
MSTFHLHPVSHPHSPSPPSSTSTATAHSPLPKQYVLRDVNIAHDSSAGPRKYPAPPTGHELMALFPPAPPATFSDMRHSTSGFFQRQERAFFAQAGREILRSWPPHSPAETASSPSSPPYPRSKPHRTMPGPPPPASPHTAAPTPAAPANNISAPPVSQPAPLLSPQSHHHPHDHHQLPHHPPPHPSHPSALGLRPPHDHHHQPHPPQQPPSMQAGVSKVEFQVPEDYRDDNGLAGVGPGGPDDSWRRPTPYSDRRRAGKHTRRVFVRT